jgi:tetratricopeptide (TPR) repeat protein
MSNEMRDRAEGVRLDALEKVRAGEFEPALIRYDQALALAETDELRELITINKADALISLGRNGPEVQALRTILMRRRNLHHTFLAAYALVLKHRLDSEITRGIFYGQIALDVALEAKEPLWHIGALNELGILYEIDSQFDAAIECFSTAIAKIDSLGNPEDHKLTYGPALENLGASKLLKGDHEDGIAVIQQALPSLVYPAHIAEAYIDLCYGYLALDQLERAAHFGLEGLGLAEDPRQIRNARYLLGEVAHRAGDIATAEMHFEELGRFYPEFRNLKDLLMAIDVMPIVNLKL